jgi:hypothetical protein
MNGGDEIVAIALLNEPTFAMLKSSLKRVYRIDDNHRFDDLIRQLDQIDAHRS